MTAARDGERRPSATAAGTKRCTRAAMVGGFGMVAFPSPPRDRRRSPGQPRADKRPGRTPAPLAKSAVGPPRGHDGLSPRIAYSANQGQRHADVPRLANSPPLPRFVAVNQILRLALLHRFVDVCPAAGFPEPQNPGTQRKRARLRAEPNRSGDPKLLGTAADQFRNCR